MNVRFLNPFIEAASHVIQAETGFKLTRGQLNLTMTDYVTDDVTVIISMVGDVEGNVFYSMNEKTATALSSAIIKEELAGFDSLAQSGIAELSNVITGRASVLLSDEGFNVNISPPTLITGERATISTLEIQRLIVPMNGPFGALDIHLALRAGLKRTYTNEVLQTPTAPNIQSLS